MKYNPTCLVTLSGGIDSTVLVHYLVQELNEVPLCVYIKYGTISEKGELIASRITCNKFGLILVEIPFTMYKDISESFILGNTKTFDKGAQFWLDGRNGLIGFILAIMAARYQVYDVYMGTNADDDDGKGTYLDTNIEFYDALNELIKHSIKYPVKVSAPFLDNGLIKSEVIKFGNILGVDWMSTHSCSSSNVPCLKYDVCESCYWRREDFKDAGLSDPFEGNR